MAAEYHYGVKLRITPTGLSPASAAASLAAPPPRHERRPQHRRTHLGTGDTDAGESHTAGAFTNASCGGAPPAPRSGPPRYRLAYRLPGGRRPPARRDPRQHRLGIPPLGARRPLPAGSVRLGVAEKGLTRHRIAEAHLSVLGVQLEPQRLAAQGQRTVRRGHRQLAHIVAPGQAQTLQHRGEVLPGGVVLPVLLHPQARVDLPLPPQVFTPCALRGHLQHEVRRLALLPDQVVPAHPVLDPQHPRTRPAPPIPAGCPPRST